MLISFPLLAAVRGPLAPTKYQPAPSAEAPKDAHPRCPECAGPVARSARCQTCVACGWSRCR